MEGKILLEMSRGDDFSFEVKLILNIHKDRFCMALQEPKSNTLMQNLSQCVLCISFASNNKTTTELISNRTLEIHGSLYYISHRRSYHTKYTAIFPQHFVLIPM
jgi:hypothetical protein